MSSPRLILASQSPARLATLKSAGINPLVRPGDLDEERLLANLKIAKAELGLTPSYTEQVLALAEAKATAVAASISGKLSSDDFVLGCDTMLDFAGELLGKPASQEDAFRRLQQMRGGYGMLYTGHWLINQSQEDLTGYGEVSVTKVNFGDYTDAEISAYIATGEPLVVAGCFTIDGFGGPFIDSVEGCHHGVVGISLPALRILLGRFDRSVTEFWDK